jgi:hypothetical protein
MNAKIAVFVVLAIALWALGYFISMAPRLIAVLCWIAAFGFLCAAAYLHVRDAK